ncbi:MAG TPA: nucleotidyltransferase domain-containing protein, partial [Thermomicrobiales bacterium]|nr:nucleotidyltransferase domain-containing protein [Thermomicrobiales bacterium]
MADEEFIGRWAKRLAQDISGTLAVLLKGSHVRGDAGPWSDVDFDVLVNDTNIEAPYLTWFDDSTARTVHISVAVEHFETWLQDFDEPADWAFGFAGRPATKLLWVTRPSLTAELDWPERTRA